MRKKICCGVVFGLLCALFVWTGMRYEERGRLQEELAGKILRFHVRAASDTSEDQELKLKVRDAVGAMMGEKLRQADDRETCEQIVLENMDAIRETAQVVVEQEGYDYTVTAQLADLDFPAKSYGPYTFPAGTYEALEIVIGEGAGHNWWCVMYPNMCFSGSVYEVVEEDAKEALREVLTEEEYEQILSGGTYEIRFKYFTFLNDLFGTDEE